MNIDVKIATFINKAQTRMRQLGALLIENYDDHGGQSPVSKDALLKLYETRQFIRVLVSEDRAGQTDKFIANKIDFFTKWLNLNPVVVVSYGETLKMPIEGDMVTVPAGQYALQTALAAEIAARALADQAINDRIDNLDIPDPQEAFEFDGHEADEFWNNYNATTSVVFDDDIRLHTHSNMAVLDDLTPELMEDLEALQAHYDSINTPTAVHVTTAERTAWNARITASQLTNTLLNYSLVGHTHTISEITGLQSVINAINDDIEDMAGADGDDGLTPEFQLNGDNLEYRYTIDSPDGAWTSLGSVRGPEGDPFDIDVKGLSNDRFNSLYDGEDENFSYLELDTGFMYFRYPPGGLASVPAGWSTGVKFLGDNGWSPVLGLADVSSERAVYELVDWAGGEGVKPSFDSGGVSNPRWFVGPNGYTMIPEQAVNVRGPRGAGHGPIVNAVGALATRDDYDNVASGFIFMRNDVTPQTIFIKLSDAAADWSVELPWQGPPGIDGDDSSTYTNEDAQDAVGNILTDTATIDFAYNDGLNTISASVKSASITYGMIQNVAAFRLIGNPDGSAASAQEIAITLGLEFNSGTNTLGLGEIWQRTDGNMAISDTSGFAAIANTSALVEFESDTKAILVTRMDDVAGSVVTPVEGMVAYDNTLLDFTAYVNGYWMPIMRSIPKTIPGTTYTVLEEDFNGVLIFTASTDVTITVPTTLSLYFSTFCIMQGTGNLNFTSGGTFDASATTVSKQYAGASVYHKASGVFQLLGSLGGDFALTDGDKGDITVSGSGGTWTIDNNVVTVAKISATGTPSSSTFLRGDGAWAASGGVTDGDKGDITVSSSGTVWTIDNDAVTFAKMQNVATGTLTGRYTASTGDMESITVGPAFYFSSGELRLGSEPAVTFIDYTVDFSALTGNAISFGAYGQWDSFWVDAGAVSLYSDFGALQFESASGVTLISETGVDLVIGSQGDLLTLESTNQILANATNTFLVTLTPTVNETYYIGGDAGGSSAVGFTANSNLYDLSSAVTTGLTGDPAAQSDVAVFDNVNATNGRLLMNHFGADNISVSLLTVTSYGTAGFTIDGASGIIEITGIDSASMGATNVSIGAAEGVSITGESVTISGAIDGNVNIGIISDGHLTTINGGIIANVGTSETIDVNYLGNSRIAVASTGVTLHSHAIGDVDDTADIYSLNGQVILHTETSGGSIYEFIVGQAGFQLSMPGSAEGDLYYEDNAGYLVRLPIGASTYVLTSDGTTPSWAAPTGGGGGGVSDGDKGDVVISGTGTVYTVDATLNKVWTGTHSFRDASFSLLDNSDTSKILAFQLSGITTATTRTITIPDVSGTMVLGTGTASRVAFWGSANEISSDADFTFSTLTNALGVSHVYFNSDFAEIRGRAGTGGNPDGGNIDITGGSPFASGDDGGYIHLSTFAGAGGGVSGGIYINPADGIVHIGGAPGGSGNPTTLKLSNATSAVLDSGNGQDFTIEAGNGYTTSGNANGGDLFLRSGQRRTAGAGIDGDIILDCLTGSIMLPTVPVNSTDTADHFLIRDVTDGEVKKLGIGSGFGIQSGVLVGNEVLMYKITDDVTPITAGTNKIIFHMPYAFTVTAMRITLTTAQTSGTIFTVDVNEGGTTVLSTKLTIDNTEDTSATAATPCVISDTALADGARMTVDVDTIGNGTAVGLALAIYGYRT